MEPGRCGGGRSDSLEVVGVGWGEFITGELQGQLSLVLVLDTATHRHK